MATERSASVVWQGDLLNGSGTIAAAPSGAFGAARRLVGVARRGAERQDEPRGADRLGVGQLLRDGPVDGLAEVGTRPRSWRRPRRSRSNRARGSQRAC